jgi:hypothetical protein
MFLFSRWKTVYPGMDESVMTHKYGRESGPTTVQFSIVRLNDVKSNDTRLELVGDGRAPYTEGGGVEPLPHED